MWILRNLNLPTSRTNWSTDLSHHIKLKVSNILTLFNLANRFNPIQNEHGKINSGCFERVHTKLTLPINLGQFMQVSLLHKDRWKHSEVNMIELTVCIYQESRAVVIHVGRTLLTGKDSQWSVIDCHDLDIWILCCKFYMYGTSGIYSRLKNKRDPYPFDVFEFWTF